MVLWVARPACDSSEGGGCGEGGTIWGGGRGAAFVRWMRGLESRVSSAFDLLDGCGLVIPFVAVGLIVGTVMLGSDRVEVVGEAYGAEQRLELVCVWKC